MNRFGRLLCALASRAPRLPRALPLCLALGAGCGEEVAAAPQAAPSPAAPELFVSPAGDDGNPGTQARPFRTLARGLGALAPGLSLVLRGGVYEEAISFVPAGASWQRPVTVRAAAGEPVVLRPPAGAERVVTLIGTQYVVLQGLVLDGSRVSLDGVKITYSSTAPVAAHHVRLVDCEIKNAPHQGVLVTAMRDQGGGDHNEFLRLKVHDNGTTDFDHGYYLSTVDNLIEGGEVYRNAGWGVHVYAEQGSGVDRNQIRGCRVHDNARAGRGAGILLSSGADNAAADNEVSGNATGIQIDYGARRSRVLHNLISHNQGCAIVAGAGSSDLVLAENVLADNGACALDLRRSLRTVERVSAAAPRRLAPARSLSR